MVDTSNKEKSPAESLENASSLAEAEHDGELAPAKVLPEISSNKEESVTDALETLRESIATDVLASKDQFASPFQLDNKNVQVPLVYCDQTASNRTLQSVEDYIQEKCLPLYGNTHTNTSITGAQSTAFVAEARQIVAEETNARITGKASLDVVLFA